MWTHLVITTCHGFMSPEWLIGTAWETSVHVCRSAARAPVCFMCAASLWGWPTAACRCCCRHTRSPAGGPTEQAADLESRRQIISSGYSRRSTWPVCGEGLQKKWGTLKVQSAGFKGVYWQEVKSKLRFIHSLFHRLLVLVGTLNILWFYVIFLIVFLLNSYLFIYFIFNVLLVFIQNVFIQEKPHWD